MNNRNQISGTRLSRSFYLLALSVLLITGSANVTRAQWATSGTNINTTNTGNVGIGTTTPTDKLEVAGGIIGTYLMAQNTNTGVVLKATGGAVDQKMWAIQANINRNSLYFSAINDAGTFENLFMEAFRGTGTGFSRFHIYPTATFGSNVGIGTATPQAALDVAGNINTTGTINAIGTITGGNIVAKYQDVAEWVPSTKALAAGTVVALDSTQSNFVTASSHAYDTKVAGVISAQPGITLGESGANKVLVATTGRVKVKVDATHAPIHVGDLLVTSSVEGYAMKSMPLNLGGVEIHRPGTLIGKALEPLEKGTGEILVLLSLQ